MSSPLSESPGPAPAVGAGVVTALVGFTSSFAVVLTGLRQVGATADQAASGLLALSVTMGLGTVLLAWRRRLPITLAWSTPGAALIGGTGVVHGGWAAAVGAFIVVGVLIVLTGLWKQLGELIGRIPHELAQAMLAGVLLPLCLAPVRAAGTSPWTVVPTIVVWLVLLRVAKRWAVPGAFAAAAIAIGVTMVVDGRALAAADLLPRLTWTTPAWSVQAALGLALPLFIVTMASQNIPGVAVLASFGYRVPWRASMLITGVGTVAGAPAGGHAINLAAISAALAAGPQAHPDKRRRWIAALSAGACYLVLALASAALVALVGVAPRGLVEAVAGLALLATLGSALAGALAAEAREAAVLTFLVAASGVSFLGIGSAFWALLIGLLLRQLLTVRNRDAGAREADREVEEQESGGQPD